MPTYTLSINGFTHSVDAPDPDKPLLYVLRDMGLTAAKFGCGLGQCGACTVLIDGKAGALLPDDRSPPSPASRSPRLKGLGSPATPHPVQAAFIKEQVPQCGYCTSGMIMSAAALLARKAEADRGRDPRRTRRQSLPLRHPCARRARRDGGIGTGRLT